MSIITIYDAKQYSGMRKAKKICKITLQEGLEPSTSRYHVANKPTVVEVLRATIAPLEHFGFPGVGKSRPMSAIGFYGDYTPKRTMRSQDESVCV